MQQSEELITVSTRATARIQHLLKQNNNLNLKLRIYIVGGGCSGFKYEFNLEDNLKEDDFIFNAIVIDPLSIHYLEGAEIDYKEDLLGARFIVNNPNAQTTCGCGSSFSIV